MNLQVKISQGNIIKCVIFSKSAIFQALFIVKSKFALSRRENFFMFAQALNLNLHNYPGPFSKKKLSPKNVPLKEH